MIPNLDLKQARAHSQSRQGLAGPLDAEGLTTDALRRFDEQGKKVGLSSSLLLALRVLAFRGESERKDKGGRLDSERYLSGAVSAPTYEPEIEACREALS